MARKHVTKNESDGKGGKHVTKHSYPGQNHRRTVDIDKKGNRSGDHQVDQGTKRKLTIESGKVKGEDKNVNRPGGIGNWLGFGGGNKKK